MGHIAKIGVAVGVLGFNFAFFVPADAEDRVHNLCGWSVRTPAEAFDRLAKQQKVREIERTPEYLSFHDQGANRVWTFTVAGHPAHPAAICRYATSDEGGSTLQLNIDCGRPKPACDELAREFEELNRSTMEKVNKQKR
jgi:hypothetical protein